MKKIIYITILLVSSLSFSQTVKSETARYGPLFNFYFSVSSDIVSYVGDCFTVNVRVYMHHDDGELMLIVNQNVQVGGCGRIANPSNNSFTCQEVYFKEDLINGTKDKYKYCLNEILEDATVYDEYKYIITKLLDRYKK